MIRSTTNTVGIRHKPRTTAAQRLKALELAEKEERKILSSGYATNLPKGHYKQAFPNKLTDNPYYRYFHSEEGDEATTQSLLPDVFASKGKNGRRKTVESSFTLDPNPEVEEAEGSSSDPSVQQPASNPNVEEDDPTYKPGKKKKSTGGEPQLEGGKGFNQRRGRRGTTRFSAPPPVDITTLQPKSAELYVKYEKLYRMMLSEDREFVGFRSDYLARQREIELEQKLRN